jgi:hypothetical protein
LPVSCRHLESSVLSYAKLATLGFVDKDRFIEACGYISLRRRHPVFFLQESSRKHIVWLQTDGAQFDFSTISSF